MLPEIRRILFCTDLSETAANAFRYAVSLAKATGGEIHIMHAASEFSHEAKFILKANIEDAGGPDLETILKGRVDRTTAEVLGQVDAFWATADEGDIALKERIASVDVSEGHPADAILARAKDVGCDLIVMGAHEKGFAHAFLGSVSKTVLRNSKIPVLVVPLAEK